ncbi:MAG: kelch repeat-containing protein [Chthoniobacterales bacterium]
MKKTTALAFSITCLFVSATPLRSQIVICPKRTGHAATLLNSGLVLITGGANESATLDSVLLYNPATGRATPTGAMTTPRENHTSSLLPDGTVLIAGGEQNGTALRTAEI